ncbi:MAG: glycosyltransferase family 2 protein [Elusimicrobiota bacterium]
MTDAAQPRPKVSIIILHFKDVPCLRACLESLEKITYTNHEVIVVNNGPDELTAVEEREVRILRSLSNVGFARGNNSGIMAALQDRADYVLLLNDDTVVRPDFLDLLVDAGESDPDAGMLGPMICYFDEPQRIWFAGAAFDESTARLSFARADEVDDGKSDAKPEESDFITGCALLVKRALIERVGLLDERYFLYWEDVDWGLRAKESGYKCIVVPAAKILHKVSRSTGGQDSALRSYHKTRSHLLLAGTHAPRAKRQVLAGFARDIAWLLVKSSGPGRGKKARAYLAAMIDHYLGRTGEGPRWLWTDDA